MTIFSLTRHAENRLSNRSSLSREEFLRVLDFDRLVLIGLEQSYSSNSYLFFSLKDSDFFVVVIDVKTNEIITILPIDFWLNLNEKGNYKITKKLTRNKLFEAVYKQDKKHKLIEFPPKCDRNSVSFLVCGEKKGMSLIATKVAVRFSIDDFMNVAKEKIINKIKEKFLACESDYFKKIEEFSVGYGHKISSLHDKKFFYEIEDYDHVYRHAMNSFSMRNIHSKEYPIFETLSWG
ncbi:hypothetical protein N9I89_04255 [Porticoccaceae bacterium]|nr:hypothetical protein [Porticoccaceae bacterium]